MALSTFKFFTDAALTTEFTGDLTIDQAIDGSTGDVDRVLYLGSTATGKTLQTLTNPGVDQINLSISDTTVDPGNGPEVTDLKLALTLVGLDSATAGAALDIGTSVSSGVGNNVPIYIRQATPTVAAEFDDVEISISTNSLREI